MMCLPFIAPHLAISALDDRTLRETTLVLCTALELWVDKKPLLDTHSEEVQRVCDWIQEADHHFLCTRLYLLHASMEEEYRHHARVPQAAVLKRVPHRTISHWPIHTTCIGRTPKEERTALVESWCARAEEDDVPIWTTRNPPEWLLAELWRHQHD